MVNFQQGVLSFIYGMLYEASKKGFNIAPLAIPMAISYVIGLIIPYVLLAIALKQLYAKKRLNNGWQCFVPIVQLYAFIRVINGTRFWGMSRKTISILYFSLFGAALFMHVFCELYFFSGVLKIVFGKAGVNVNYPLIVDVLTDKILSGEPLSARYKFFIFMQSFRELLTFLTSLFFVPLLLEYFKPRTRYAWLFVVLSFLSTLFFALFVLIFINMKATPAYRVVYTNPNYNNTNNNTYNNSNNSNYKEKEPFSDFNKDQPFKDFNEEKPFKDFEDSTQNKSYPFSSFEEAKASYEEQDKQKTNSNDYNSNEEDDLF